jgi:anthranilate phosphoribosyltransferase
LSEAVQTPRQLLEQLLERRDLAEAQAYALLGLLTDPSLAPALAGALLAALRAKGTTAEEVRGFAAAMRALARKPALPDSPDAIDIVGTGGDASGSLNLSTGAALLTAACGMPVVKHGNRSISSRSGSADLIEQLGLKLPLDETGAARCLAATDFTFLFAPYYHPAMRALAPIRTALGVRTIFNLLGPLTNPAAPRYRLIGAYDSAAAQLMAETLAGMDIARAWDEVTPIGPFLAFEITPGNVKRSVIDPRTLGLASCGAAALAGGDAAVNAAALCAVFERRDRGAHLSALALQSGLALYIAGRAPSIEQGIATAIAAVEAGRAQAWLERLRQFARDEARASMPDGASGAAAPGAASPPRTR